MQQLHTVYDFSRESMHQTFLIPLTFAIVGAYILMYVYGLTTYYIPFVFQKFKTRQQAITTGSIMTIATGFLTIIIFNDNNKTYSHYRNIYQKQQYTITEGRITDFHHSTDRAHDPEHFVLNNVYFEFRDNSTDGYGYSLANRDVLKPHLFVRIAYFNNGDRNVILKLETE